MPPDQSILDIAGAIKLLREGDLVAIPTETVYGLGADASSPAAVAKIFAAKQRPDNHPLIVHIAGIEQLETWASEIPPFARKLAEHFWPGSLTLILRRSNKVPDAVTGGQNTVGLRVPAHPLTLELLRQFGGGISAPSANRFGRISATTPAHVRAEFGNAIRILDGGPCEVGIESTIIDCSGGRPVLLRPGGVSVAQLTAVLGEEPGTPDGHSPRASGTLASHYAPQTPVMLVLTPDIATQLREASQKNKRCGVLLINPDTTTGLDCIQIAAPSDATGYAHALYANLRSLDEMKLDLLLIESPPATAEWMAVNDRLNRAAYNES